eukprot:c18869_g1_i1 orf=765-2924(-)
MMAICAPRMGLCTQLKVSMRPADFDTHASIWLTRPIMRLVHSNSWPVDDDVDAHALSSVNPVDGNTQKIDIASVLQGVICFQHCKLIHAYMLETGLIGDIYLVNLVLRVYAKCGAMLDARSLFNAMPHPSVISWNIIISAYVRCSALEEACILFDGMLRRNVVSWNILIAAYAHQGKSEEAIFLFQRLYQETELPNDVTFLNVLSACSNLTDLKTGMLIHVFIKGRKLGSNLTIGTALVSMYAKCRALNSACLAFGELHQHDVVSWTSLISAYAQLGDVEDALMSYRRMQQEGVEPNKLTFLCILSAVANKVSLYEGKAIHASMCFGGFKPDAETASALINMYGKCGSIRHAWLVFENVASSATGIWNSMIVACIERMHNWQALSLYRQMLEKGLKLNEFTFASALSACACLMDLNIGALIHSHLVEEGHMLDVTVSNALITLYTKCKALEDGNSVFEKMQCRSVVTWTCMIAAYGQEGLDRQSLNLFYRMQLEDVKPNDVTIVAALGACVDLIALEEGKTLHAWIAHERKGLGSIVNHAIVNMYGKCGSLSDACFIFNRLQANSVVSWNAMMAAYACGGHGKEALACFFDMQGEGVEPDELTFVSLLCACSHAGMVDEGGRCFSSLAGIFYIPLVLEHCVCIVDLLGRAGHLDAAEGLIDGIAVEKITLAWSCLLGACKVHGDVERGARIASNIFKLDPKNAASYITLLNIYTGAEES